MIRTEPHQTILYQFVCDVGGFAVGEFTTKDIDGLPMYLPQGFVVQEGRARWLKDGSSGNNVGVGVMGPFTSAEHFMLGYVFPGLNACHHFRVQSQGDRSELPRHWLVRAGNVGTSALTPGPSLIELTFLLYQIL